MLFRSEAFRQDFSTDWSAYVAEAQEQLLQAIEACRRAREAEIQPHHDREAADEFISAPRPTVFPRVHESTHSPVSAKPVAPATAQFQAATASLTALKALVPRLHLPHEGLEQFLSALRDVVEDLGNANPEVLRLVLPYREFINGEEGLGTLSRNLERLQHQTTDVQSCDAS